MSISETSGTAGSGDGSFEEATYRKLAWRLVPFLFLCYIVAYLDRVNVGFAKLQMLGDLQFSETVYGLGAGIFFLGYFLFEVPSNIILHKVGARVWIARIMLTWGVLSSAMMFVATPLQFYVLRFLLGRQENTGRQSRIARCRRPAPARLGIRDPERHRHGRRLV